MVASSISSSALVAFVAVAHELHFGRAAARLHADQSGVTRLVQQLERQLGVQLFKRSTRRVALTEAGSATLTQAEDLITALSKLGKQKR
jgi:DNA-binding transcriptional LysR family regulator